MPEFPGLDKKKWLWIGVAVAGVAGLYLLMHRGGSGTSASDAGLPSTGPPQIGNMTPSAAGSSSFDQGQVVAASLSDRYHQLAQMNADNQLALTEQQFGVGAAIPGGTISKGWQQIAGGWSDLAHPGHLISEQQAEQLGPQNHGPYAKGGGGFFGTIGTALSSAFKTVTNSFFQAETGVAQAQIGSFAQSQMPAPPPYNGPYAPGYRPPVVPNASSYGNPPVRF